MADKKPRREKFITPKGVAIYPWLNKADTKWKPEGEYRVKLRVPGDAAAELIEKLEALRDEVVAQSKKDFAANPKMKGKKYSKDVYDIATPVLDDDGNETGDVEFTFKRQASGKTKAGKVWAIKPDLFDAKGKPLSPDIAVYGGSIMKVSFEVVPYDTPKSAGIKLSLAAVQVLKVVEGGGRSADAYGFGYESDDEDAETTEADDTEAGDGTEDEDDF